MTANAQTNLSKFDSKLIEVRAWVHQYQTHIENAGFFLFTLLVPLIGCVGSGCLMMFLTSDSRHIRPLLQQGWHQALLHPLAMSSLSVWITVLIYVGSPVAFLASIIQLDRSKSFKRTMVLPYIPLAYYGLCNVLIILIDILEKFV